MKKSKNSSTTPRLRNSVPKVSKARQRSVSSQRWLKRQLNDPYVQEAQHRGYRSRAAFKLLQLQEQFQFLRPGMHVVDLGAAPGGWSQIASQQVTSKKQKGQVFALDILEFDALEGVHQVQIDFMEESAPDQLHTLIGPHPIQVVLSDMAPDATGHARTDHLRIMALAECAFDFAKEVLIEGGTFVTKVWQGGTEAQLLREIKHSFKTVRHVKPDACRKNSKELYLIAMGFHSA